MEPTPRIRRLRETIVSQPAMVPEVPELLWARGWLASAGEPWHIQRRAQATAAVLRGLEPTIGPDDRLVGRFPTAPLSEAESAELERWRQEIVPAIPAAYGQRAHMAIDYDKLLRLGLCGLRDQIATYRARLDPTRPEDLEKDAFYRAAALTLDALGDYARRYADHADAMAANEPDPARRAELSEIAAVCRRVPEGPAATFREALQAIHFVTFSLCAGQRMLLFQLGRPDRYLWPLYQRDLAAGRITPEEALEWLDDLCLMLSAYTPRGLAVGFMVGGRDPSGADVSNALTRLFLETIAHTRLSYPGIGLCWNSDTPPDITRRAVELLGEGLTHPALFNDDVITRGLSEAGLPPAEACLYVHSTCVEITPIASSNVYVASPYLNLVQLLHDLLGVAPVAEKAATGPVGGGALSSAAPSLPPDLSTFDGLLTAYERHLAEAIRRAVVDENTCQITRRLHGGYPLLSCFVNDCLAAGKDIDQGGARHNWVEPSFVGLANLVDALVAIRLNVFERRELTLNELAELLRRDFDGAERERLRLLNNAPKYGNDDDPTDALATRLTAAIRRECGRYRTALGGQFHPGFFCWVMHERLGAITAASADGRRAGQALGDGSGPAQGRERRGPTAAVLSATKWEHHPMLGGIAVNLKFARTGRQADWVPGMERLVETFMRRGGFELQLNVIDAATLRAARAHPDQYRDLVVRIGGYSDYFVGLSPRMQDEIIQRTEHGAP